MCVATNNTDESVSMAPNAAVLLRQNSAIETLLTQTGPTTNKKELHHA